ncbi:hypothetical protein [Haloglomus litoreum]|uniref:hypothetical protein n=1 Tax=Haloglomus litoreum TaxID=3034026 RepID=UPI0023E83F40|nr:hypothetical protein [Haloglomus sp. DT116]
MRRRALLTGLGAGVLGLAGCSSPFRNRTPTAPQEPPSVETRIAWDAEFSSYEIDLVDGRFTDANTGELAVRVRFPDADPYRKVWAGGQKADRFPVEAGDELIVTTGQRGTVRLLWEPPGGGDTVVLYTYRRSEQPTPTER